MDVATAIITQAFLGKCRTYAVPITDAIVDVPPHGIFRIQNSATSAPNIFSGCWLSEFAHLSQFRDFSILLPSGASCGNPTTFVSMTPR